MKTNKEQLIKEHKQRMFDMRFMGTDWQLTHQKRWDDNTLCWDDECDCEERNERTKSNKSSTRR